MFEAQSPTELALNAEYRWWGQFNKQDIVIDDGKTMCWHANFVFFTLTRFDVNPLSMKCSFALLSPTGNYYLSLKIHTK